MSRRVGLVHVLPLLVAFGLVQAGPPARSSLAATAGSVSAAPVPVMGARAVAEKLRAHYAGVTTYEATFKQTSGIRSELAGIGTIRYQSPDKMLWEYQGPKGNVLASDGRTVTSYDAKSRQLQRTRVIDSLFPSVLSFLSAKDGLAKDCHLSVMSNTGNPSGHLLTCVPKRKTSPYSWVSFYVDGTTFDVLWMEVVDLNANRNRFDFKKPVTGKTFAPVQFTLPTASGTTVLTWP